MGSANINDRSQKGDGDSEIALVVEDNDMIQTTMNGKPYMAARFAATLRRKLYRGRYHPIYRKLLFFSLHLAVLVPEHLGLIPPQDCTRESRITGFMRAAPVSNPDETRTEEDARVADPLADETLRLWEETARENRDAFTEIFRSVPCNKVRDWKQYGVRCFP